MTRPALILIGILVLLGGVYAYFFWGESPEPPISASQPAGEAEQEFIELAARLDSISFDTSIFQDPRFSQLVSLETEILPETIGRSDPFAPIGR